MLVNGTGIATERLNSNRPREFYDVEYALPSDALAGQPVLTVKFQAHPAHIAGGVYDVRVVKPAQK